MGSPLASAAALFYTLFTMKEVIVSGIQPTGELHIGNYLGAIKNWLELQKNPAYECFFFVPDLHSLTIEFDPTHKREQIYGLVADLLALGINPKRAHIFVQSEIAEHTELCWYFLTITPISELEKMTQFKDKAAQHKDNINAGLFTYPVLMAADILLYHSTTVPVGEDQIQHVETTRVIAKKFNARFGKTFAEPKPLLTVIPRVMSLLEPQKKMSKSHGVKSYIALADGPETIQEKLRKATTDERGVKNLLNLLQLFDTVGADWKKMSVAHGDNTLKNVELKDTLARHISDTFADYRARRARVSEKEIRAVLATGRAVAQKIASKTIADVRQKIGLTKK